MATTSQRPASAPQPAAVSSPSASKSPRSKALIRAHFANAVAINFSIKPSVLEPNIPPGLEIDYYKNETYISLTCMEIRRLPFLGLPVVPRYCELSLRCFVSETKSPDRKGVLYLKSFASGKLGAWVMGSHVPLEYQPLPIKPNNSGFGNNEIPDVDFQWKIEGNDNRMRIRGRDRMRRGNAESKLAFIMSHSTRYVASHGKTYCFQVERPEWELWDAAQANFTCDVRRLFGKEYVKPLAARPVSAFISSGSEVVIHRPIEL